MKDEYIGESHTSILSAFDPFLIISVLALVTIGVCFIYSSGINSSGILVTNEHIKQIIWGSVGFVFMLIFALYDYRRYMGSVSKYLYIALIAILIYTTFFGRFVNGAKSWIGIGDFGVQPSEFGKVIFILFLARYLAQSVDDNQLKRLFISGCIFAAPVLLILMQPDLGTASVYIPIFFFMCFMAQIPLTYLTFLFGIMATMVIFTVLPVWNEYIMHSSVRAVMMLTNMKLKIVLLLAMAAIALICAIVRSYLHGAKYFFWIGYFFTILSVGLLLSFGASKVLKEYQIQRLIIFMDPSVDSLGAGWNINQSKIAIGSGGSFGRGFLGGTQSHYRFLPQQSTDFIFSIFSEEMGFRGGLIVFSLYMIIIARIILIIKNCKNNYGTYIASGILGMFVIHFFINVGMVMGIMPITGIPLMFLSYGGSSLFTGMICIGLVMSIDYRKNVTVF